MLDTRKDVENILVFLCGRAVPFKDAFRLGRFKNHDDDHPPRPLLVKLSSTWDKRLILAAKRNLKDYRIKRLFIREDLSPEVRKQRAQQRKESSNPRSVSHSHSSSKSSSGGNINLWWPLPLIIMSGLSVIIVGVGNLDLILSSIYLMIVIYAWFKSTGSSMNSYNLFISMMNSPRLQSVVWSVLNLLLGDRLVVVPYFIVNHSLNPSVL